MRGQSYDKLAVIDYAIYSHILCSYQGRELTNKEREKAKKITLLFLLSDALSLINHLKTIESYNHMTCKNRLDEILLYCDIIFCIPDQSALSTKLGVFNKIFYCLDQLNKFEKNNETNTVRKKLYLEIKKKINQNKLDLSIMKRGMYPYDKKEPDFCVLSFVSFFRSAAKKLLKIAFSFLEKYLDDQIVLDFLNEKKHHLYLIFGRKKTNALLLKKGTALKRDNHRGTTKPSN